MIRLTVEDTETGDRDAWVIGEGPTGYVVTCGPGCQVTHETVHVNGTVVLTIKPTPDHENDDSRGHAIEVPPDIHTWFSLTYANYLVLPRSILQSMPDAWQYRFVALLQECEDAVERAGVEMPSYRVQAVDSQGRFMRDPVPPYNRGRTYIPGLDPTREVPAR